MNSAIERLLSLRVADAMSKDVVRLSPRESMADAAETLVDHHITGAPVVDKWLLHRHLKRDGLRARASRPTRRATQTSG